MQFYLGLKKIQAYSIDMNVKKERVITHSCANNICLFISCARMEYTIIINWQ